MSNNKIRSYVSREELEKVLERRDGFTATHRGLALGRACAVTMCPAHGISRAKIMEIFHWLEVREGMTENPSRDGEEVVGIFGNGNDKTGARENASGCMESLPVNKWWSVTWFFSPSLTSRNLLRCNFEIQPLGGMQFSQVHVGQVSLASWTALGVKGGTSVILS